MAKIDTATVLFTDLVGSTEMRARIGEDAAEDLRRTHDQLLADAVAGAGGRLVKGLGDGILATFDAAADAVAGAIAIQQAVELHGRDTPERAFAVRVGLSVGDVTLEDDDVFGTPVVEASRLCGAAVGGEILVAEVVRVLARGRGATTFEPIGELELKGLPEAVPACRVVWEPLPAAAGRRAGLPALLVGGASTAYVGRDELRAHLAAAWEATRDGGCRTVLLAGEPGVGKTRTAAEVARRAHAEGALVLYGRCDAELSVPYQPFVEALDWYVSNDPAPLLGRFPGDLARLVPDLRDRVDGLPEPVSSDPRTEEHRLFEATASWLTTMSADAGAVVVLDDVHWAARPTLAMLLHVVRHAVAARGARLLVLATYRDTDVDRTHPLSAVLGDLRRLPGVERRPVDGLSCDEVEVLVSTAAGHDLDETMKRLAATLHSETEGNPFFVGEVLRHLVETGAVRREGDRWAVPDPDHVAIPEGVRDVVGRRLSQLSDRANAVLSAAAVVGRDVDLDVVIALVEDDEDAVLDALDEAVRARLVEETGPDRYRFAHALVRTTLHEELSATRRRRHHRRVADVLEKLRPDDVVALSYHCIEAGPDGGDVTRAVRYTVAAGERALAARARADAETRFSAALELLEDADGVDPRLGIEAEIGLAVCRRDRGDHGYREALFDAARRADAVGAVALLVRAVLENSRGLASIIGDVDEERVELTERALEVVGADDTDPDRIKLLAHLAGEVTFAGDHSRRLRLADEAERLARAAGDPALLAWTLVRTTNAHVTTARVEDGVARMEEALRLAVEVGDPALEAVARVFLSGGLLVAGRVHDARRASAELIAVAEREGTPLLLWGARANMPKWAAADGDLARAAAENDAAVRLGTEIGEPDAESWWAASLFCIRQFQGSLVGLADLAGSFADQIRTPVWRCGHVMALVDEGRHEEAREILSRFAFDPVALLDEPWPVLAPAQLAIVAFGLDDADLAGRCVEALAPYDRYWVQWYTGMTGPVLLALGLARVVAGDVDRGVADLERAAGDAHEAGCTATVALCRTYQAESLARTARRADAVAVAAAVREVAERLGADGLVARLDAVLAG